MKPPAGRPPAGRRPSGGCTAPRRRAPRSRRPARRSSCRQGSGRRPPAGAGRTTTNRSHSRDRCGLWMGLDAAHPKPPIQVMRPSSQRDGQAKQATSTCTQVPPASRPAPQLPTCSARPSPTSASSVYVDTAPRSVPRAERRPATTGRPATSRAHSSYSWIMAWECSSAWPYVACAAWHSCSSRPALRGSHTLQAWGRGWKDADGVQGHSGPGQSGCGRCQGMQQACWGASATAMQAGQWALAHAARTSPRRVYTPARHVVPLACQHRQAAALLFLRPFCK